MEHLKGRGESGRIITGLGAIMMLFGAGLLGLAMFASGGASQEVPNTLAQEGPDFQIQKNSHVFGPQNIGYEIDARARGEVDLSLVEVQDIINSRLQIVSISAGAGWTCGIGGQTVTCEPTSALDNQFQTVVLIEVCDTEDTPAQGIANNASISYNGTVVDTDSTDPNIFPCEGTPTPTATSEVTNTPTNTPESTETNTPTATSTPPEADVTILKESDFPVLDEFENITYTITVTNTSAAEAEGVRVRDDLPDDWTNVDASWNGTDCNVNAGNVVVCNIGDVAAGASVTVTITATVGECGEFDNSATVVFGPSDSRTEIDSNTVPLTITCPDTPTATNTPEEGTPTNTPEDTETPTATSTEGVPPVLATDTPVPPTATATTEAAVAPATATATTEAIVGGVAATATSEAVVAGVERLPSTGSGGFVSNGSALWLGLGLIAAGMTATLAGMYARKGTNR